MSDIDILPSADREKKLNAFKQFEEDVEYLAKTLYGEVRSENDATKLAVAWTIRNRKIQKQKSIKEVVTMKDQYSCWREDDVNYYATTNPDEHSKGSELDLKAWKDCKTIAQSVLNDVKSNDITNGCTHYHDNSVLPNWALKENEPGVEEVMLEKVSSAMHFYKGVRYSVK